MLGKGISTYVYLLRGCQIVGEIDHFMIVTSKARHDTFTSFVCNKNANAV
jgi:hypothetical protein